MQIQSYKVLKLNSLKPVHFKPQAVSKLNTVV